MGSGSGAEKPSRSRLPLHATFAGSPDDGLAACELPDAAAAVAATAKTATAHAIPILLSLMSPVLSAHGRVGFLGAMIRSEAIAVNCRLIRVA